MNSKISAQELRVLLDSSLSLLKDDEDGFDLSDTVNYWAFSYYELFDSSADLTKCAVLGNLHHDIESLKDDYENEISSPSAVLKWISMVLYAIARDAESGREKDTSIGGQSGSSVEK